MKAKIVGFLFPLCCLWVGKELTIFTLSKTLTVLTENIYGSFCRTCRGFSVDSKLAGNVRDAQLPDSFRSRMYVDFHKSVYPASFQDFISESLKEVFLVGLESLARAWMERGEKPKVKLKLMRSLSPPEG